MAHKIWQDATHCPPGMPSKSFCKYMACSRIAAWSKDTWSPRGVALPAQKLDIKVLEEIDAFWNLPGAQYLQHTKTSVDHRLLEQRFTVSVCTTFFDLTQKVLLFFPSFMHARHKPGEFLEMTHLRNDMDDTSKVNSKEDTGTRLFCPWVWWEAQGIEGLHLRLCELEAERRHQQRSRTNKWWLYFFDEHMDHKSCQPLRRGAQTSGKRSVH